MRKYNKIGYKPRFLKKIPRKPTDAEPIRIKSIYTFCNNLNFEKLGIIWNKGTRGPKGSDPAALLSVWLYGYQHSTNEGRALEKELKRNRDLQYLSKGYLFSDSVLNKFRRALGSCLDELFKELIKYEGDPKGDLGLDGTQIGCAGSHHQFREVQYMETYMDNHKKKGNHKRALEYKSALEYSICHPKLKFINLREHSSRIIRHNSKVVKGYIVLALSDSKRHIYGIRAYGQVREISISKDFLEEINNNPIKLSDHKLLADKEYYEGDFLEYLSSINIDAYIPYREDSKSNKQRKEGRFTKGDFKYNEKDDHYICPNNKIVYRKYLSNKESKNPSIIYSSNKKDCKNCKYRLKCLPSKGKNSQERRLSKTIKSIYLDKMKEKMELNSNKKIYNKRSSIIEPIFSIIKDEKQCNIHRFVLKGEYKVNIETVLMAISSVLVLNRCNLQSGKFKIIILNLNIIYLKIILNSPSSFHELPLLQKSSKKQSKDCFCETTFYVNF